MKIQTGLIVSAAILFIGSAPVGWGGTITITNPSFENGSCGTQGASPVACFPVGWTQGGNDQAGNFLPTTTDMQAFDGSQYGYVNGGASLDQVLSATIQAGAEYDLTIWVANRTNAGSGPCSGCVFDPQVELVSATTDTVLGLASGSTPAPGGWTEWTLDYVAPSSGAVIGQSLEIVLTTSDGLNQGAFDLAGLTTNATVSSVPEPSTFLFAGAGLLGLGFTARRRRLAR
jgi:hypothetical protein